MALKITLASEMVIKFEWRTFNSILLKIKSDVMKVQILKIEIKGSSFVEEDQNYFGC